MNKEFLKKTAVIMLVLWNLSNPGIVRAEAQDEEEAVAEEAAPAADVAIEKSAADGEAVPSDEPDAPAEEPAAQASPSSSKLEDELSATFDEAVPEEPVVQSTHSNKKKKKDDHILEPGDRLKIKIYPEDDYIKGGDMQVSSEGNITLPLIGKILVNGKTAVEAEREIVDIIDRDYLVNPEVVIEVMERTEVTAAKKRTVIVFGQVRKPGPYDFPIEKKRMTLLEVISLAGGFTEIANYKKIKIVRKEGAEKTVINVNGEAVMSGKDPDVELVNGDVITVSESLF